MQEVISKQQMTRQRHVKSARNQSTLVNLASRFTLLNRPSSKDVVLFREQFYILILNTNSMERKEIAKHLARSEYAPKPIIIFFAMEEISIANLPLLYSPVLKSADLNLILTKCSIEHAKVIARRSDLDASNVKALLSFDDDSQKIKHILKANDSLMGNVEITAILENSMISNAWIEKSPENTTNLSSETTKEQISNTSKDLSASLLKLANKGGKIARKPTGKPAKNTSNAITVRQIETQLLATARYKNLEAFAISIQHYCGLNHQETLSFIHKQDAGMLATLLCALEITDITAARILLMMNSDIGQNAQIFKTVMKKYRNLDQQECILYFKKLGANFTHSHVGEENNRSTTRYALSLAARDRRVSLLKHDQIDETYYSDKKLTA